LFCRAAELEGVFLAPGVLLTTYGMVQHNAELFCSAPSSLDPAEEDDDRPLWDFLILDEVGSFPIGNLTMYGVLSHQEIECQQGPQCSDSHSVVQTQLLESTPPPGPQFLLFGKFILSTVHPI
jgi:hypothetical protein